MTQRNHRYYDVERNLSMILSFLSEGRKTELMELN